VIALRCTFIGLLVCIWAFGQTPRVPSRSGVRAGESTASHATRSPFAAHPASLGLPALQPIPPIAATPVHSGTFRPSPPFPMRGFRPGAFIWGVPLVGATGPEYYTPVQNIIIVQQQPFLPALAPATAEEIGPSRITEYKATASESLADGKRRTFTIVLCDGAEFDAVAVMAESTTVLRCIDSEGRHRSVRIERIDREASWRVNAEKGLQLRLPAPAEP
jgi:hypothetical protein